MYAIFQTFLSNFRLTELRADLFIRRGEAIRYVVVLLQDVTGALQTIRPSLSAA